MSEALDKSIANIFHGKGTSLADFSGDELSVLKSLLDVRSKGLRLELDTPLSKEELEIIRKAPEDIDIPVNEYNKLIEKFNKRTKSLLEVLGELYGAEANYWDYMVENSVSSSVCEKGFQFFVEFDQENMCVPKWFFRRIPAVKEAEIELFNSFYSRDAEEIRTIMLDMTFRSLFQKMKEEVKKKNEPPKELAKLAYKLQEKKDINMGDDDKARVTRLLDLVNRHGYKLVKK